VANEGGNTVSVIATASNTVVARVRFQWRTRLMQWRAHCDVQRFAAELLRSAGHYFEEPGEQIMTTRSAKDQGGWI
jgi:DNA-binding beta-propeller fold protein YncE